MSFYRTIKSLPPYIATGYSIAKDSSGKGKAMAGSSTMATIFNASTYYTTNNPAKAGFTQYWKDRKWTYLDSQLKKEFDF